MSTSTRRPARSQQLPADEVTLLHTLDGQPLYQRAAQLYNGGWTLRAIGEACYPPRERSTVSGWIAKTRLTDPTTPIPTPVYVSPREYVPVKPISPGISLADEQTLRDLAPSARRYRAGMGPTHPAAQANTNLTSLAKQLAAQNVTTREIADAAGVSYRAMAKRLEQK